MPPSRAPDVVKSARRLSLQEGAKHKSRPARLKWVKPTPPLSCHGGTKPTLPSPTPGEGQDNAPSPAIRGANLCFLASFWRGQARDSSIASERNQVHASSSPRVRAKTMPFIPLHERRIPRLFPRSSRGQTLAPSSWRGQDPMPPLQLLEVAKPTPSFPPTPSFSLLEGAKSTPPFLVKEGSKHKPSLQVKEGTKLAPLVPLQEGPSSGKSLISRKEPSPRIISSSGRATRSCRLPEFQLWPTSYFVSRSKLGSSPSIVSRFKRGEVHAYSPAPSPNLLFLCAV